MIIFYLNPFKNEETFLRGWGGGRVKMAQNVLHNSWTAPVIEIRDISKEFNQYV